MPTSTYTPLANITLGSSASTVTFSSIPATYRDLIIVVNGSTSTAANVIMRFNGDSGSNYSQINMAGPTEAGTGTYGEIYETWRSAKANERLQVISQIMDYSATDKHKTRIARAGYVNNADSSFTTQAGASRWASTSAITSVLVGVSGGTFNTGSTFALYAIVS